jgi:hypothetical protein
MSITRAILAILAACLIAFVLPDYIGLGVGFRSFAGHSDLTANESRQYYWLSVYCALMIVALAALAITMLLYFTKVAGKVNRLGITVAIAATGLAVAHVAVIYFAANAVHGEIRTLFIQPSESRAWMVFIASIAAIALFALNRRRSTQP